MPRLRNSALAALLAMLAACNGDTPAQPAPQDSAAAAPAQRLGLMTSLPLYWPLGAGVDAIASGRADLPWQREALEQAYTLVPLDTLSPIPALSPDAPDVDPLAGLTRLAVIQPRGLSPADNVALDDWVRAGGRLLLVLDPMLTGEYDLPLGDPRRPSEAALIPPVVARWGMTVRVTFYENPDDMPKLATLPDGSAIPLAIPGNIELSKEAERRCVLAAGYAAARCQVGKGQVTLIADAGLFEHPELAGDGGAALRAVLAESVE
jgi:hypothetical protein